MIKEDTISVLKRDSLKALFSIVLLVLGISRCNLGNEDIPAPPGNNLSTLEMIRFEEQMENIDLWSSIYAFSDNITAITCLVCAVVSGLLVFYKNNDGVNKAAVLVMMSLLSSNVITILVSDLSSWQIGYR